MSELIACTLWTEIAWWTFRRGFGLTFRCAVITLTTWLTITDMFSGGEWIICSVGTFLWVSVLEIKSRCVKIEGFVIVKIATHKIRLEAFFQSKENRKSVRSLGGEDNVQNDSQTVSIAIYIWNEI